jgi:tellurite resistance protein TehA-like permease
MRISKSNYYLFPSIFTSYHVAKFFEPVETTVATMKVSNLLPLIALLLVPASASYIIDTVDPFDYATVSTTSNDKERILA